MPGSRGKFDFFLPTLEIYSLVSCGSDFYAKRHLSARIVFSRWKLNPIFTFRIFFPCTCVCAREKQKRSGQCEYSTRCIECTYLFESDSIVVFFIDETSCVRTRSTYLLSTQEPFFKTATSRMTGSTFLQKIKKTR